MAVFEDGTRLLDGQGEAVELDRLGRGEFVTAFPEGGGKGPEAAALLLRLDPEELEGGTVSTSVEGYLAYSKVCTHRGCLVDEVRSRDPFLLSCPCHSSVFAPGDGGEVRIGTCGGRLPPLPLKVEEGFVVAAGGFLDEGGSRG